MSQSWGSTFRSAALLFMSGGILADTPKRSYNIPVM